MRERNGLQEVGMLEAVRCGGKAVENPGREERFTGGADHPVKSTQRPLTAHFLEPDYLGPKPSFRLY